MKNLSNLQGFQERLIVDTSEKKPVYLLVVGNSTYIRLSPTSYYLLQQRSLGTSFESLAEMLSQQGKYISSTEVEFAYNKVVSQIKDIECNPQLKHSGFFCQVTLIPKAVVAPIASFLSVAFYKPVAYCLVAGIALAIAVAPRHDFSLNITSTDFLWSYLLFFGSLLMHELGHASACVRYGAQPSDIGFTLYLIWPAFYSDVSAAWELKRWQRVVVDVGGVFFQLVIASIYVLAYTFTAWIPLKLALIMIVASCFFSLNPFFKFDGYWIVADALGVTNLSQQPSRIFQHFLAQLCQRSIKPLPWSPLLIVTLAVYTVLNFGIWSLFLWIIIPLFWKTFLNYPSLVKTLIPQLMNWAPILSIGQLQSFLGSTFLILIAALLLWRLLKTVLSFRSKLFK